MLHVCNFLSGFFFFFGRVGGASFEWKMGYMISRGGLSWFFWVPPDKYQLLNDQYLPHRGYAVVQSVKAFATSRKFAVSIANGATGIFHWHNPSSRTMVLGSTQLLIEMSARNISWRCAGLITLQLSCADCLEIWEPQPLGALRACSDLCMDWFFYLPYPFQLRIEYSPGIRGRIICHRQRR